MKKQLTALLVLLSVLLCSCGTEPPPAPDETVPALSEPAPLPESTDSPVADSPVAHEAELEPDPAEKAVTVMVYMTGSDLESGSMAATADLEEMAQSGVDLSRVNLLVYTGGAQKWFSDIPTEENVLLQLTPDGFQPVGRYPLLSMGDPDSLSRFLTDAWAQYPAERFDLILWNHGNGPIIGYGKDKLFENDSLTLPELKTALEASSFGPDRHLGIIGFDACLMASAELACVTADYADYLISSQETEPFFGWNYAFLALCGSVPAEELACAVGSDYLAYCEDYYASHQFFRSDVTMSVVDLSCAGELEAAVDALFSRAADLIGGDYNPFAVARIRSRALGRASTGSEYDLVDLESLIEQMSGLCPDEVGALREVLDRAVVSCDTNAESCCGLSLYYPYFNPTYYQNAWKEEYWELGLFPKYLRYLEQYEQVWLSPDQSPVFSGELVPEAGSEPQGYQLQLTEEQQAVYAYSYYIILRREGEGLYKLVYISPQVSERDGLLQARFDGNIIYMENDFGDRFLPAVFIRNAVGSTLQLETYGAVGMNNYVVSEGSTVKIQLSADTAAEEVTINAIYPVGDDPQPLGEGKQVPDDLSQWIYYASWIPTSRYLIRDENGMIPSYWSWPENSVLTWHVFPLGDGLKFCYEPLVQDGYEYYLIFDIADVYGNRFSSEPIPVSPAEAPAIEESVDESLTPWTGGCRQLICEQDGVRISMVTYRAMDTDQPLLAMLFENDTDDVIGYTIDNWDVNDEIRMDYWASSLYPHEKLLRVLHDATEICAMLGIDRPDSVSFTLDLNNNTTGSTLIRDRRYCVLLTDAPAPDYLLLPWSGASAENQLLAEENGVSITLVGLGSYLDLAVNEIDLNKQPDELDLLLCLDSRSASPLRWSLDALIVNGETLTFENGKLLRAAGMMQVDPNMLCHKQLKYRLAEVPEQIVSLELVLTIDGVTRTVPISLDPAASGLFTEGASAPES